MEKALYLTILLLVIILAIRMAREIQRRLDPMLVERNRRAISFAKHVIAKQRRCEDLTKEECNRLAGYQRAGILSHGIAVDTKRNRWVLVPRITRYALDEAIR